MPDDDLSIEEFADGFALWEEHRPQTSEDWVKVAERVLAANDPDNLNPSPLFAAVLQAVAERDSLASALQEISDLDASYGETTEAGEIARSALSDTEGEADG